MTAELAMQHCLAICGMAPVDPTYAEPGKPGWRKV